MSWAFLAYRRYFDFSGRSRRMEYWLFALFTSLVALLLIAGLFGVSVGVLQALSAGSTVPWQAFGTGAWLAVAALGVFFLVSVIPGVAVQVRRLHDLGVSGWWYLAFVVAGPLLERLPGAGSGLNSLLSLGWLVWMFMPGTKGPNRYGDDPKDPLNAAIYA
jgi:uncharacterized membrane protein YhaH (DUF805 family)